MKKVIRGFLIAAVVLVLLGTVLGIGGLAAGGMQAAENRFRNRGWQQELDELDDFDDYQEVEPLLQEEGMKFPVSNLQKLDIQVLKSEVQIIEGSSDEEIYIWTDQGDYRAQMKNGCLSIRSDPKVIDSILYVEIPSDFLLWEVDIQAGAALIEIPSLNAKQVEIEVGAGEVEIGKLSAEEADFEVGAGLISVNGAVVENCSVSVDIGEALYEGTITRAADVECNMGSVSLQLTGQETDYNYQLECATGSIDIGNNSYSGLGDEKFIDHHAAATIDVECAMGTVSIEF